MSRKTDLLPCTQALSLSLSLSLSRTPDSARLHRAMSSGPSAADGGVSQEMAGSSWSACRSMTTPG
eukprot:6266505-Alexandrium_andersonii.AAC.1